MCFQYYTSLILYTINVLSVLSHAKIQKMSFQYYPTLLYRKCAFNIILLYCTVLYRKCAFSIIPTQLYFTENVLSISSRSIIQKISFPIRGWSVGKDLQGKTVKSGQTENWQLYSCTNRELTALFLY